MFVLQSFDKTLPTVQQHLKPHTIIERHFSLPFNDNVTHVLGIHWRECFIVHNCACDVLLHECSCFCRNKKPLYRVASLMLGRHGVRDITTRGAFSTCAESFIGLPRLFDQSIAVIALQFPHAALCFKHTKPSREKRGLYDLSWLTIPSRTQSDLVFILTLLSCFWCGYWTVSTCSGIYNWALGGASETCIVWYHLLIKGITPLWTCQWWQW